MSRTIQIAIAAAAFLVAPAALPTVAPLLAPGVSGSAEAATNLNTSRTNRARATTVKSSKSNTSDRMEGGGGGRGAARATTVKSSKSNTSDRMGGGGGRGGGGMFGPAGIGIMGR